MAEEPVDLVRRTVEAFDAGDYQKALAALAEDIEWDASWYPTGGVSHGHEGVAEVFRDWVGLWDDFKFKPRDYVPAGDHVLVTGRQSGRSKETGIEVHIDQFQVWTVRGGKVARVELLGDRADALRAAGLD